MEALYVIGVIFVGYLFVRYILPILFAVTDWVIGLIILFVIGAIIIGIISN